MRRELLQIVGGIGLALALVACQSEDQPAAAFPLLDQAMAKSSGDWQTECVATSSTRSKRVQFRVVPQNGAYQASIRVQNFDAKVDCSGAVRITDVYGDAASDYVPYGKMTPVGVAGMPPGLVAARVDTPYGVEFALLETGTPGTLNLLTNVGGTTSPGSNWDDWLRQPNVTDFANDPADATVTIANGDQQLLHVSKQ